MKYAFQVTDDKRVRVIVSTDTACEADDPFAIAHALLSPKMDVRAIVAEHFMAPGSMEKSCIAARKVASLMNSRVPVLRGQVWPKVEGEVSEGAQFIIDEARRDHGCPLYVLCMGAMTTMAAALAAAPDIADRLTVVSIGGHAYNRPHEWREFNWGNDPDAVNAILRTSVPLWQIPSCCYATMRVGLAELQRKVAPCGELGAYLLRQMNEYNQTEGAGWTSGEAWSLGDNPSVAVVLMENCGEHTMQEAHVIHPDTSYGEAIPGRMIRVYTSVDSRYVLEDLFSKIEINFGQY